MIDILFFFKPLSPSADLSFNKIYKLCYIEGEEAILKDIESFDVGNLNIKSFFDTEGLMD